MKAFITLLVILFLKIHAAEAQCTGSFTMSITVNDCVGIEEENNQNWNIYPNPSSDFITIKGLNKEHILKITDIEGKEILHTSNHSFDVSAFDNGMYIVNIYQGNTFISSKYFVKK